MHNLHLGCAKQLLRLTFRVGKDPAAHTKFPLLSTDALDDKLVVVRLPKELRRKPRPLTDLHYYKSSEYRNATLILFPLITQDIADGMPDHPKLDALLHVWQCFVYAARLVLLPRDEFDWATAAHGDYLANLLDDFYRCFTKLFGRENCSSNIHNFTHLDLQHAHHRTLADKTAYPFESCYALLTKGYSKGSTGPGKQGMTRVYSAVTHRHKCATDMHLSDKQSARADDRLVYGFDDGVYSLYAITDVKPEGQGDNVRECIEVATSPYNGHVPTEEHNWGNIGVFCITSPTDWVYTRKIMVHESTFVGKFVIVDQDIAVTIPADVLNMDY